MNSQQKNIVNQIINHQFLDQLARKGMFALFYPKIDAVSIRDVVKYILQLTYKEFIQKYNKYKWITQILNNRIYAEIKLQILIELAQMIRGNPNHRSIFEIIAIQLPSIEYHNSHYEFLKGYVSLYQNKKYLQHFISYHFKHNKVTPQMLEAWKYQSYFASYNQNQLRSQDFMQFCMRINNDFQSIREIQEQLNLVNTRMNQLENEALTQLFILNQPHELFEETPRRNSVRYRELLSNQFQQGNQYIIDN